MGCAHNYVYTQGYFYCTKCGHRNVAKHYRNRKLKSIGIISGVLLVLFVFVLVNPDMFNMSDTMVNNKSLQSITTTIPESIENISAQTEKEIHQVKENLETHDKPELNERTIEFLIYQLTNEQRKHYGLSELILDPQLASIARSHSNDMAIRHYYDHNTPEGLEPTDRANLSQYKCVKKYGDYYTEGIAENIAQSMSYSSYTPNIILTKYDWSNEQELSEQLVTGWMNSKGHRENILSPDYDSVGIGIAISEDDYVLATQNFC